MLFDATVDGRTVRVEVRGREGQYTVILDGQPMAVDLQPTARDSMNLLIEGRSHEVGLEKRAGGYRVVVEGDALEVDLNDAARGADASVHKVSGPAKVAAPMPGKIVRVLAALGQQVSAGDGLLVMEAMKMENELKSPRAGTVLELKVREQQAVEKGALLVVVG